MTHLANPARIPMHCSECSAPIGYVSTVQVAKAQAFTPWRGWALAAVVDSAGKMLSVRCPACEQAKAPRPEPVPHPTLGV